MKRFLVLFLVVALILPMILTGCNKTPVETSPEQITSQTTPEETTPEPPTTEEETPLPEGQMRLKEVTIIYGTTAAEKTAAQDLKKYLKKKGVTVGDTGLPITLSLNTALGDDCYRVTAVVGTGKEQSLLIEGGNGRGILYGVYNFLEEYADARFYTPEFEVCNAGEVIISDGVLLDYTPVFALRQTDWYNWMNDTARHTWAVKNGINIVNGWKPSWNEALGGSLSYAPSLFVHTIGKLAKLDTPYPGTAPTPCLTDENIYNTVLASLREALAAQPDSRIVSVSQNDNNNYCKCATCSAIEKEEGSPAGVLLRFVNRIAEELADEYPDLAIDTLAYQYTQQAPKITKPRENVCIRLSTIRCHFNHPITKSGCTECAAFRKAIEDWSAICENIYIWDYTTNYSYYMAPFPNLHVLRANMQFFAEHNVKGVYEQGNGSGPSGEFGELRAYLITRLMKDPYMSDAEYYAYMDQFLADYYGEGWQYIRKYIDTLSQYAKMSSTGMGIYSYPFTVMSKDSFASLEEKFNEWWDAAEEAAGIRIQNVKRSRWQLRYMSLYIHPDSATARQLVKEVEAVKAKWSERDPNLLWYAFEYDLLALTPDKWFTPPAD